MKLIRRLLFWVFVALIVIPILVFGFALLAPAPSPQIEGFASIALPAQGLAAFGMLIWSAICLKIEPGLARAGILLSALALLLLDFVNS
jgi:hypothetical protein